MISYKLFVCLNYVQQIDVFIDAMVAIKNISSGI